VSNFRPQNNQNFAQQTFTQQGLIGDAPLTQSYALAAISAGSAVTVYDNYVLVGYSKTNKNLVGIYNADAGDPDYGTFAGFLFSDEVDYATASASGALAVPVAYSAPAGMLVPYSRLIGYNGTTTEDDFTAYKEIDAIITAGGATKRYISVNGVQTLYVQFQQTIGASAPTIA
jgi:hypothetical protein